MSQTSGHGKRPAIFVGKVISDGKVETHMWRDLSTGITIGDVRCPTCGGPGVHIYPRLKLDVYWPVICYWCGANDYEFTSILTRPNIQRSQAWIDGMTRILIDNMSKDMVDALTDNGKNLYDV